MLVNKQTNKQCSDSLFYHIRTGYRKVKMTIGMVLSIT